MAGSVLHLRHLAHSGEGRPVSLPGTDLWLSTLATRQALTIEQSCWLTLLAGELIIDLPDGDFRVLKLHDFIVLPVGQYGLVPLEACVVLSSPLSLEGRAPQKIQ
jgi:hypothetical protein